MKFLIATIAICCSINLNAQSDSIHIYYTPVVIPTTMHGDYYATFDTKLLAKDLADLLHKATGKDFASKPFEKGAKKGIFLLLDSSVKYSSNEEGILESDGINYVRIKARYLTGVSYAMYSWLEDLGFHFYLPGEEWITIPTLGSFLKSKIIAKKYKPYFKLRMMGASGGIFPVKGLDENLNNQKDWQLWHRRNKMGSEYIRIDGHIGELFNIIHQKEIEKEPGILAPVNGKRQYSSGGKLDPTNKKGVDLFSDWIVTEFKKEKQRRPYFLPFKKYYTVDAGDGLNYCHTPECERQFKTVSDQVFSIANETARKIRIADPSAGVSTLAYTERTDTPFLKIEPNVHVQVVPTAFQSVSTATELMQRWSKKTRNFSQYDFLNIGVWSFDQPFYNLNQYFRYMKFLKTLNVDGISFETSLSKFGSGVLQYFILQFLCNPSLTADHLLENFCKNNFGNAAAPVKKLLKEWYFSNVHLSTNFDRPTFYEDELGRFIKYLTDADQTPGLNDAVKKRIEELKGYTVYLCRYYEFFSEHATQQAMGKNPMIRKQKAEELLTYTWQLYFTKVFHNTQLNDMLKPYTDESRKAIWDYNNSSQFSKLKTDVPGLIHSSFETVKKKYLPFAVPFYELNDDFFLKNIKNNADSIKITTIDEVAFGNYVYPLQFFCVKPGVLKISYHTGTSAKNTKGKDKVAIVGIESDDFRYIKNNFIYKENSKGIITYRVPAKGHYKLYLSQFNATHMSYVIYPGSNMFYHNKKSLLMNAMLLQDPIGGSFYPNEYMALYTPQTDSIFYSFLYHDGNNSIRFFTRDGSPIPVNTKNQPSRLAAAIPSGHQKSFIFYNNTIYRWPPVLKNTAPYYFYLRYPLN